MWLFDKIKERRQLRDNNCQELIDEIGAALKDLDLLFLNTDQFVTEETVLHWRNNYAQLIMELQTELSARKLKRTKRYEELSVGIQTFLLQNQHLEQRRNAHNNLTANQRAAEVYSVIGAVEGKQLDRQQLVAISKDVHTHLVLAGAGTGKTTTIVGLVKYLLKTKQYTPDEILVLSFTNASAAEMRDRIQRETGAPIETSTFHKLGMNIITAVNRIKPIVSELMSLKFIRSEIELYKQNEAYFRLLNMYLLYKPYLNSSEFDYQSMQEYQAFLETNPPTTLKKERVKSYGEVDIANFLYLNGITYEYEARYKHDTRTSEYAQYKPDFYLPDYDIYIEYFGIDRNGNPPDYFQNDYIASMEWKRKLHRDLGTTMIESFAYEKFEGTLTSALENKLREKGVVFNPCQQEEIWRRITEENKHAIDGLVQLIESVINLMKSNRYDIQIMRDRCMAASLPCDVLWLLDIIEPIWDSYIRRLNKTGEIDFNDMINNAADYVREGRYKCGYKMVIVDEYQDISKARYELLRVMRSSMNFRLFCVGDDWQSIYRFSGSDISYIQHFPAYWGASEISRIETTYRFPQRLIDISSAFIMNNPQQLRKNIRGANQTDRYALGEIEGYTENNAIQFMLSRLDELPRGSSVYMIGRYTFDCQMLEQHEMIKCQFDNLQGLVHVTYSRRKDLIINFMTAHKSKGLQADYVFILNNKRGRMGFPSRIQDSQIFKVLLEKSDQFPDAEERRLFYVAMTRAKKKVILITIRNNKSSFVQELLTYYGAEIKQEAYICPLCGGRLRKRTGKYGAFFGCENYRTSNCRFTRDIPKGYSSSN